MLLAPRHKLSILSIPLSLRRLSMRRLLPNSPYQNGTGSSLLPWATRFSAPESLGTPPGFLVLPPAFFKALGGVILTISRVSGIYRLSFRLRFLALRQALSSVILRRLLGWTSAFPFLSGVPRISDTPPTFPLVVQVYVGVCRCK